MLTPCTAVERSVQQHLVVSQSSTIYVACSGGRDSMALLAACHHLKLPITVIHINHQLQAPSVDWQRLVEAFCAERQIACVSLTLDWAVQEIDASHVNEQLARQARYQAIAQHVEDHAVIALAHHADDQAETMLLNLCQGTGVDGLVGMQPLALQQEFGKPLWLWRPLLAVSRDDITQFVHQQHIPYVDDPTNLGDANRRAWLRQAITPQLKQAFPALLDNLNRTAQNLADAKAILTAQSETDLQCCQLDSGWTAYQQRIDITAWQRLGQPRAMAVLRKWLKGTEKFPPSRQFVEQVYRLATQTNTDQQAILQWQGIHIRRYQQVLYRLDNDYLTINKGLSETSAVWSRLQNQLPEIIPRHADKPVDLTAFTIRRVLPNERFERLGNDYHEPFKKLCQRQHIPSWERDWAWVLILPNQPDVPLVLLLPSLSIWLAGAKGLGVDGSAPCPLRLLP